MVRCEDGANKQSTDTDKANKNRLVFSPSLRKKEEERLSGAVREFVCLAVISLERITV